MRAGTLAASLVGVALEIALVRRLVRRPGAFPFFSAFLAADALFGATMAVLYLGGLDWLTIDYARAYSRAAPVVVALLAVACLESVGRVSWHAGARLASLVVSVMVLAPAPGRIAVLGACCAALVVSLTARWALHPALLLGFVLADVVASLAILIGPGGTLEPGAFLVVAQLVPLVGWWGLRAGGEAHLGQ